MSFKFAALIGCLFVFLVFPAASQTESDRIVEQIIESMAESAPENFDYSELLERLNTLYKSPLNLNKASADQLQELAFLSPLQIEAIMNYRNEKGYFLELYELQSISCLDPETIKRLTHFSSLTDATPFHGLSLKALIDKGSLEMMFTYGQVIQKQKGFRDDEGASQYSGGPQRFLSRYKYRYGRSLSAAMIMENDAGEAFFGSSGKRGFDFYSGNISYQGDGRLKKLIVGDYSLQFGQGLSMWSGLSFGKGAAVASITKNNIGLRPYSSTNEILFLRGIASTITIGKIDFTPFVSLRNQDGALEENEGTEKISSIKNTGFHRTTSELQTRSQIKQLVYGGNVQFSGHGFRIAGTAYQTQFSHEFEQGAQPYNSNDFASDKLTNIGLSYTYNWHNLYFFGETAHSVNSGYASLNGVLASLSPKVSLILFHRNYQKDYHSFFNQAVSEGTNAVNERGFYSGLVISPSKKIEFNMYADFFRFPWLRFRVDAPSSGYEILSQLSYSPSKKINAVLRYKFEQKEENNGSEEVLSKLAEVRKQNYRFEVSYKLSEAFQLKNRVEVMHYRKNVLSEHGVMIFQDLNFNPLRSRLSGNCRFAVFDTPGFNSRLYAFENDVLYSYSVPAYHNQGTRFYLNGRWRINRSADLWLKYAITSYADLNSIGTGPEMIDGNKKSDLKLQLRFQF